VAVDVLRLVVGARLHGDEERLRLLVDEVVGEALVLVLPPTIDGDAPAAAGHRVRAQAGLFAGEQVGQLDAEPQRELAQHAHRDVGRATFERSILVRRELQLAGQDVHLDAPDAPQVANAGGHLLDLLLRHCAFRASAARGPAAVPGCQGHPTARSVTRS